MTVFASVARVTKSLSLHLQRRGPNARQRRRMVSAQASYRHRGATVRIVVGNSRAPGREHSLIISRVGSLSKRRVVVHTEPDGRPHIECPKCRTCVVWPGSLTLAQATAFAD